jgi:hypothetical protein
VLLFVFPRLADIEILGVTKLVVFSETLPEISSIGLFISLWTPKSASDLSLVKSTLTCAISVHTYEIVNQSAIRLISV